MPLIALNSKLEYYPPWNDGSAATPGGNGKIGLSRDWTDLEGKLTLNRTEYIKELGAIAPAGDARPTDMTLGLWSVATDHLGNSYNDRVRNIEAPGNPVCKWLEFYDSKVYPTPEIYAQMILDAKAAFTAAYDANEAAAHAAGYSDAEAAAYATPYAVQAYREVLISHGGDYAVTTYATALRSSTIYAPNLSIRTGRYSVPKGQCVVAQTSVIINARIRARMDGSNYYLDDDAEEMNGWVTLMMPFDCDVYKNPVLAWQVDTGGGIPSQFRIFSEASFSSSTNGDCTNEYWSIEWIEDPALIGPGGHIIVRNSQYAVDAGTGQKPDFWQTYQPCIRLVEGTVGVLMAGCRQHVNVSPITYASADMYPYQMASASFKDTKQIPSDKWNLTATWPVVATTATNWTVGAGNRNVMAGELSGIYSPVVSFTPATGPLYTRPVVWLVSEDHPDVLGDPYGETKATTENIHLLRGLKMHIDRSWKSTTATAEMHRTATVALATWYERGKCDLTLGWQADPAPSAVTATNASLVSQSVGTLYIMPGGIPRDRIGDEQAGNSGLTIELGSFIEARMRDTEVIDFRQAGGRTISDWFHAVGHRLGLPDSMIDVAAEVAEIVIPLAKEVPSKPSFAASDGSSWENHVNSVVDALGYRWGWKGGKLFIDAHAPVYAASSTISLELDIDAADVADRPISVRHLQDASEFRTGIKINYGREGNKRELYFLKTDEVVRESAGADYWAYIDECDATDAAVIMQRYMEEHAYSSSIIEFDIPLRAGLLPDQFVKIKDVPELGLTTNAVYQIHEVDHDTETLLTTVIAKAVMIPTTSTVVPPANGEPLGGGLG